MSEGQPQSMECPTCGGRGTITVIQDRRCDIKDCDELAVWDYYNDINHNEKDLCAEHLENLRSDVSTKEWVEGGFAKRIQP